MDSMSDTNELFSPLKVLYVDDDLLMHDLLRGMLNRHQVTSAYSLEHAKQVLEYLAPDVIFCDLMMPLDNGISVLRHLRTQPEFVRTPVVILTAADESLIETARSFKPTAILQKPFAREALNKIVEQIRSTAQQS
jgi:CheY-like chemotaxis protein